SYERGRSHKGSPVPTRVRHRGTYSAINYQVESIPHRSNPEIESCKGDIRPRVGLDRILLRNPGTSTAGILNGTNALCAWKPCGHTQTVNGNKMTPLQETIHEL